MKKIEFKMPEKKVTKITNERQTLIKEFLDILNTDRGKYPPITPARLGVMLAPVKTKDLYVFLADCKYASHFGKYFWSRFKKEKVLTKE